MLGLPVVKIDICEDNLKQFWKEDHMLLVFGFVEKIDITRRMGRAKDV